MQTALLLHSVGVPLILDDAIALTAAFWCYPSIVNYAHQS